MLVLRLEHWPQGEESKRRRLGVVMVQRTGGADDARDYAGQLWGKDDRLIDTALVTGFPGHRIGVWPLMAKMLDRLQGGAWKNADLDAMRGRAT